MRKLHNILVTGGAGFIGTNFIYHLFDKKEFDGRIINVDKLTYASDLSNLSYISKHYGRKRYIFEKLDLKAKSNLIEILKKYAIDTVIHFAAESHVDNSIANPDDFIQSNIVGTYSLIDSCRQVWKDNNEVIFHHVSTDEVYGQLQLNELCFTEESKYSPRSPYSASKACSDHLVRSYFHTYDFPCTISNCSNNYGPYQHEEKLIPKTIKNILELKSIPVYGDGSNIRDWLYVDDHCNAIWTIVNKGDLGETYNIGGETETTNLELVKYLCERIATIEKKSTDTYLKLIKFVTDRPGHDLRYGINCTKLKEELNWKQSVDFYKGLDLTINYYKEKYCAKV